MGLAQVRAEVHPYPAIKRDCKDSAHHVRLLVSHRRGQLRVYSFSYDVTSAKWMVIHGPSKSGSKRASSIDSISGRSSVEDPMLCVVLDSRTGSHMRATPLALDKSQSRATREPEQEKEKTNHLHSYCVVAGRKGASCSENLIGKSVGTVDWSRNATQPISQVQIITRNG